MPDTLVGMAERLQSRRSLAAPTGGAAGFRLEVNMPRTRAYRRRQRAVKLHRRYRIVRALTGLTGHDPRWRHWHLNCSCFDLETPRTRRTREKRTWRARAGE